MQCFFDVQNQICLNSCVTWNSQCYMASFVKTLSRKLSFKSRGFTLLNLLSANPTTGQTHSNNSTAADVFEHFARWRLKGLKRILGK